jgi:hypothetical protein
MRIKVIRAPTEQSVDGIDLGRFHPGSQYEVGNAVGTLMLAEGWAEPVGSDDPSVLTPLDADASAELPPNLIREIFPPYYDGPPALAADRRRTPRRRHTKR